MEEKVTDVGYIVYMQGGKNVNVEELLNQKLVDICTKLFINITTCLISEFS